MYAKVRNNNPRRVMFYPRAVAKITTFTNYGTPQETSVRDSVSSWVVGPTYFHQLAPREVGVITLTIFDWDADNQTYEIEFRVLTSGVDYRSFIRGEMLLTNFREEDRDGEGAYTGRVMNATNAVLADTWIHFWLFDHRDRFIGMAYAPEMWTYDPEWLPGQQRSVEVTWGYSSLKHAARWEFHPSFVPIRTIP